MPATTICLPFLVALGLASPDCTAPPAPRSGTAPSFYASLASETAQVDPLAARALISSHRANHGFAPLTIHPALQESARRKAREMARRGQASGGVPGIPVQNSSAGSLDLAEAFSGWRQSPLHNANMLNPAMRHIGIATAYAPGSKYKVFWVLLLAE